MIIERNTSTRYTTLYHVGNPKVKNLAKFPQYILPECNDQRTRSHRERDQTPSIRAKKPKTQVLLLFYPSFFLSLAQYECL